jgi:hypothetical protein
MATVSVRDEAVLESDPDLVDPHLSVLTRDADRTATLVALTERPSVTQAWWAGLVDGVEPPVVDPDH